MQVRTLSAVILAFSLGITPLAAQEADEKTSDTARAAASPSRLRFREQVNENALFLMGGPLGQSDIAYASDIAIVVDDGPNLRVLPVVGAAADQNVKDVLFLRGVDLALTDSTTLAALQRSQEVGAGLEKQIAYISVLYSQEMHVVVRSEIGSIEDLRGKKVNFDVIGSGSALHLPGIFKALGINVDHVNISQPDAIERMLQGTLDATVCICAKPVDAFLAIKAGSGLRLVGVPYVAPFQGELLPAPITPDDYPGILAAGAPVETIATTAVLITFNWPKDSTRYSRTAKFVDKFFSRFAELLKPPRQPGWQTVNLAASMPGWQRFPPAQEWLAKSHQLETSSVQAEFEKFAAERGGQGSAATEDNPLFREFLEWKAKQSN